MRTSAAVLGLQGREPDHSQAHLATHGAGGAATSRSALRALWAALALLTAQVAIAQTTTPAGTDIRNRALIEYSRGGSTETLLTNEVSAVVARPASRATLSMLRASVTNQGATVVVGTTQCAGNGGVVTLPNPTLSGGVTLDPTQPLTLIESAAIHGGEPLFVQVNDADQDRDGTAIDVIDVTVRSASGDVEALRLAETSINSGVFLGYIQTATSAPAAGDCVLQVSRDSELTSAYVDPLDSNDRAQASALVDPYGKIFDSRTGQPINGARVRLINVTTDANATVFGDDGSSAYPAEMVTGTAVTDAGGTLYNLPAGVFRFPLIPTGEYRLEITAPRGHAFPSTTTADQLTDIPGAPFRLSNASYGASFAVVAGPPIAIDVPVDAAPTQLFVQKSTTTSVAAVGDFIEYRIQFENTSAQGSVAEVQVIDELPVGLKYRTGSARLAESSPIEPTIDTTGRVLTFAVPGLAAGQRSTVRYVAEVTVAAKGKQIVNRAFARSGDELVSNTAQAIVQLREELFRSRGILMGRVTAGDCATAASAQPGVPNVRVYLEDGRYAMTDEEGKYHFEDVVPGSHVLQLDTVTIPRTHEPAACENRVAFAGGRYSQFVDLRGGALWRGDFMLQRRPIPAGIARLSLSTSASSGARLRHIARISVEQLAVSDARVMLMLPDGLKLVSAPANHSEQSGVLIVPVGPIAAGRNAELTFESEVATEATGALHIKAVALFESPDQRKHRSEPVENIVLRGEMQYESASYRFVSRKPDLDEDDRFRLQQLAKPWSEVTHLRLKVTGSDATAIAIFLRDHLQIAPERTEIIASNVTSDPTAQIELDGLRVKSVGGMLVKQGEATSAPVVIEGMLDAEPVRELEAERPKRRQDSDNAPDMAALQPTFAWLSPAVDATPAIPSIKVALQHAAQHEVELHLNGHPVSPLNFDGTAYGPNKTAALSRWRGVDLKAGDNELVAIVRDSERAEVGRYSRAIHYAGGAVRAEFVREASVLAADGQQRPVIALRMFDAHGKPARPGTLGAWRVQSPYRSWWEVESLTENQLVAVGAREPTFEVDADGIARLELEPTTQAGTAVIRIRYNERQDQELRVWLEPAARDWILVGLAEGTSAYRAIADNMQSAAAAGLTDGYEENGRVAFFAKGAIKGEYLLTLAYDSARDREIAEDRLLGAVESDRFYSLYGDVTEQRFEAATTRKLFLKLERRQFAALFGDYETGLTVTELTRYSRTFNGFKADYAGEHLGYTAFAAESDQGYVQDELRGDGTSGLYRLSRRPLIVNSDKIRIEVRDRVRTEVIVESRVLTRHLDYSIDYLNGTLFFKQPVPNRDQQFNPVFIIADYEVLQGGDRELTAGGRASLKLANDAIELGTSYINQGAVTGDTTVAGTDFRWQIASSTEVKAEFARSASDDPLQAEEANAYLAELAHVTEKLDARAYLREQEQGFGVGQQLSTEAGTRKYGVDGIYTLAESWLIRAEAFQQQMLNTDAQRELVAAELRREASDYTIGAGARHVADSGLLHGEARSQQGFVNGSIDLFNDRVTLKASQDFALSGNDASSDFPARSVIGLDYHWSHATTLFTEYEHAKGRDIGVDMTRVGIRTAPWERTQIASSVNQQASEYGPRTFAQFGLTQGWQVNAQWSLDFGVDQSRTVAGDQFEPLNTASPLASGTLAGDFLATFAGAMYRNDVWTFTSRLEHRNADEEDRWVFAGGFYREPVNGHAFAMATHVFDSVLSEGSTTRGADIELSWAYRPVSSNWIVLDRLDLRSESREDASTYESARIVNNFNANWQMNRHTQVGLQFGARYVRSTFDDDRYSGLSDLYGVDLRRDLSQRFDVGLHGTWLNSWDANVSEHALGMDVGVTLARNVWVSIGYNFEGFRDDDFEASRYSAQGPYIRFRVKADQDTFKDLSLDSLRPR